jgi:hypothetical protein
MNFHKVKSSDTMSNTKETNENRREKMKIEERNEN